jgi:hypothetical protein
MANKKQLWMQKFEKAAYKLGIPNGRIGKEGWQNAEYFYSNGDTPEEAAKSVKRVWGESKINEIMIPKDMADEIKKSISMGFNKLVTGMISPKKKGVMLINKKYQVRGVYDLGLKDIIQQMIDKLKESKINELDVFQKHQKAIAIKTLKYSDQGAFIMGGMTKDEARKFLKSIGYSDNQIKKLEESKLTENSLRTMIRTMIEQELDQFDIEDEEKDKCDIGECGVECEACEKNETCDKRKDEIDETSSVAAQGGQDGYQTPYAFAGRDKAKQKQNAEQLGYKLVDQNLEDRDWDDIINARKEALVYRRKFAEMKVRSGLTESILKESKYYLWVGSKKEKGSSGYDVKSIEHAFEFAKNFKNTNSFYVTDNNNNIVVPKEKFKKLASDYYRQLSKENVVNENIKIGSIIQGVGFPMLKGLDNDKFYVVTAIDDYSVTFKLSNKNGKSSFTAKPIRHKLTSVNGMINTVKRGDKNGLRLVKEGRRGAYHEYRDDGDKTPRQKIGESLRNVRDQLVEIEKTIDLNLRLKQETGINTQQYWKNTHRALNRINERMTQIINKIRRF